MAGVRIKWKNQGFREVRTRNDVQAAVLSEAEDLARPLGEGYVAVQGRANKRARASVIAVTNEAMRENRKKNTILAALASRGRPGRTR